jgi:chromosome segregation ATPase
MARRDKLEKDYEDINRKIEQATEAEIKKIQEKIEALKEEARQIGETIEQTLGEKETKATTKKD